MGNTESENQKKASEVITNLVHALKYHFPTMSVHVVGLPDENATVTNPLAKDTQHE